MKKIIAVLSLATMLITTSCNNSGKEDDKIKQETKTTDEKVPEKENVIEIPVPPPPPAPPSPKEVLKKLKDLPKPPLPPPPPPPPLPKRKG